MRALHLLPVLALAAAAAGGCNEFHYYDVSVTFNDAAAPTGFNTGTELGSIQVCLMSVSGADSASRRLGPMANGLPIPVGRSDLGIVELSTFADSGQLNFKLECYDDPATKAACKVGEGTTTVSATSMPTNSLDLVVNRTPTAFMAGITECAGG